ncbi:hypothetical protein F5J12DRAFT_779731 [Pisolithus orientalis]|uniref:uncharacterized protein n=1 Tax=Pisolithus orientalis TaxID=936130 RepID=UPI0022251E26|nr:uncharacterized protein F5J12DRAFT_779731 [Pisolithus orientalis]KAI6030628.1 hypothetical protein F5J12DRAFT_779731 [Pisolithus orientalis]
MHMDKVADQQDADECNHQHPADVDDGLGDFCSDNGAGDFCGDDGPGDVHGDNGAGDVCGDDGDRDFHGDNGVLIKNPLSSLHPPPVVRDSPEPTMTISESCMSTIDEGESQVESPKYKCNTEHITTVSAANGPTTHRWNEEEGVASSFKQEWQKQVGRLLEEFNKYFDELPSEAKAKYKDEGKQSVFRQHYVLGGMFWQTGKQEQCGQGQCG